MEEKKIDIDKHIPKQILRLDGKGVFLEVLNTSFAIEKVIINFVQYDVSRKGNKIVMDIPIYMDFNKFLVLANDILSGKISAQAVAEKKRCLGAGETIPKPIYTSRGGTSAELLRTKGRSRPDGMAEARVLDISPAANDKVDFVLTASVGPGRETETGLIALQGRPEKLVRVPVMADGLKSLAILGKMHIEMFYGVRFNPIYSDYCRTLTEDYKKASVELARIRKEKTGQK